MKPDASFIVRVLSYRGHWQGADADLRRSLLNISNRYSEIKNLNHGFYESMLQAQTEWLTRHLETGDVNA